VVLGKLVVAGGEAAAVGRRGGHGAGLGVGGRREVDVRRRVRRRGRGCGCGGRGRGRRVDVLARGGQREALLAGGRHEEVERGGDGRERVRQRVVRVGERVAVAHGRRQQVGAAPAQRHRLLLVQLRPLAPHRLGAKPGNRSAEKN